VTFPHGAYGIDVSVDSGQQYELLDWLEKVTFPTEAKFSDLEFAQRTYQKVVRQFIDAGVCQFSP
jgi:guanine deaminase